MMDANLPWTSTCVDRMSQISSAVAVVKLYPLCTTLVSRHDRKSAASGEVSAKRQRRMGSSLLSMPPAKG